MSTGGFSRSRLDRLHHVMAGYIERKEVPGLVLLLSRRGEVYVDAIGTQAIDGGNLVGHDTIFRIASLSKPVVAVAALILVEECKLRLSSTSRWTGSCPSWPGKVLNASMGRPRRYGARRPADHLRDLLTFRMGFGVIMIPPGTYPIQRAAVEQGIRMGPPRPQEQPPPTIGCGGSASSP